MAKKKGEGRAGSSECPRSGYMRMKIFDNVVTVPTSCKTWGCKACRDRVKRYVKMRMAHGISILGRCYLTTVTYAYRGESDLMDVGSVGRDWAAFSRWYQQKNQLRMKWFRIPELTKKGQVHLHLIVGGIGNRLACCKPAVNGNCAHPKNYEWAMAECRRECLEHELAKGWYRITGNSWVVDARVVYAPSGAANYLFKYLDKGFDHRQGLEALGFKRRWSCSRDWPAPERSQFVITQSKGWQSTQFFRRGGVLEGELQRETQGSINTPYAMKVGTPLAVKTEKAVERKRVKSMVRKVLNADVSR